MKTILGIDPGYDRLGWAVATVANKRFSLLSCNCIVTNSSENIINRMEAIFTELESLIKQHQPNELAIETLFFSKNTSTALKVSEIRGSVMTIAIKHDIAVTQYNPMTIKQSVTGYGKADKKAINKMLRLLIPNIGPVTHDDTMDAIAVALTHALSTHHIQI